MTFTEDARALQPDLIDLRRRLHRQPEIGLHLPRTQAAVLEALDGLGLEVHTGSQATSVVAVVRGGAASAHRDGAPAVLLRGDMDALPVTEEVDCDFRSEVAGVMHACGHDLHTAMLVGAAHLLAARREELAGDVVLAFQPGEEGFDGAGVMLSEGLLDAAGTRPRAAFALHVMSSIIPNGVVTTRPGPMMAASDALYVRVKGAGGHGSAPHQALDPVPAACEMVLALNTFMTRSVDPFAPAVLTVGRIAAGSKRNIIPDTAEFDATIRTFDSAVQERIREGVVQVCEGIAHAHGLTVDARFETEYPTTVNTQAEFAAAVAAELLGADRYAPMPQPITGSEDFSRMLDEVGGAMLFLGACLPDRQPDSAPNNHSPIAAFDDAVLGDGAALYAELAARRLAQP